MSFNAIRENKIITKNSEFTVITLKLAILRGIAYCKDWTNPYGLAYLPFHIPLPSPQYQLLWLEGQQG